jgi:hypothetical protein
MNTVTKNRMNLKWGRGGVNSFSQENIELIKRAYPWMRGVGLANICSKIDQYVRLKKGNDVSAREHLKGRVFGLSGVAL